MNNKKLREIQLILMGLRLAIISGKSFPESLFMYLGELIDNLVPQKKRSKTKKKGK